jgi:predicted nucleic acid-binding Zn ribbon protein
MSWVPANKNKKPKISSGSEVLQALFENGKSELSVQFIRWKLWMKWSEFVGPTMGQVSEPVGYKDGTLFVWVKNSSWMQQMVFMREPLRDTINKKLEKYYVKEIRLTMDRNQVPADAETSDQLKDSISSIIKDQES